MMKQKILSKKFIGLQAIIIFLLSTSMVFAIPGTPHHFYGSVTVNGAPAPDGTTVSAVIDGSTIASTSTSGGKYGQSPAPVFYVPDTDPASRAGKTVTFFVNGVDTKITFIYANGKSDKVDLSASISSPPSNGGSGGGSGGGGGGGSSGGGGGGSVVKPPANTTNNTQTGSGACTERWTCSDWSSCSDGFQTRTCTDANACGTDDDKPIESQPCTTIETGQNQQAGGGIPPITAFLVANPAVAGGLVVLILIILFILWHIYKAKGKKPSKGSKKK